MGMHGRAKGRDRVSLDPRIAMPRSASFLIVLLLLLVGGAWFLSSHAHQVPLTKIETDVARAPTAQ